MISLRAKQGQFLTPADILGLLFILIIQRGLGRSPNIRWNIFPIKKEAKEHLEHTPYLPEIIFFKLIYLGLWGPKYYKQLVYL